MKVTSGNFRHHISWKQSLVDGRSTVRNPDPKRSATRYFRGSSPQQEPTATNASFRVGQFHEKGVHVTALRRNPLMSRLGVTPKRRPYSRLNCEELS